MTSAALRYGLGIAATAVGVNALLGDNAHRGRVEAKFPGTAAKAAAKAKLAQQPKLKVTYFDFNPPFAGTAGEQLRVALALTVGIGNFDDDKIVFSDWSARKPTMKYGQVPVLTVDGEQRYQSGSTLRFIGSTLGDGSLYPADDPQARLEIDEMIGVADDLQRAWDPSYNIGRFPTKYGYSRADPEVVKKVREAFFKQEFPRFMGYITAQLKRTGGAFIAGDKVSIADCRLLPQLSYFERGLGPHIPDDVFAPYPEVKAYLARLRAVPEIADWPYKGDGEAKAH